MFVKSKIINNRYYINTTDKEKNINVNGAIYTLPPNKIQTKKQWDWLHALKNAVLIIEAQQTA